MSNPFLKEARSTVNSKLHKMGGSGPDQYARAEKLAHAKYADGGAVKGDKYAPVRQEGINRLKTQSRQSDAQNWRDAGGQAAQDISDAVPRMKKGGCT